MKNIKRIYTVLISLSLIIIVFSYIALINTTNQCDEIGKATIKDKISVAENNMYSENSVNTQLDTFVSSVSNNSVNEIKEPGISQNTSLVSTITEIDNPNFTGKIIPTENWYHINPGLFTDDELYTVNLIIKKMNENRYSSLESERFEVSSSIGSDSYYKIVSFFAIYFGEWDTTRIQFIDVCVSNDYNTGIKKSEVVLYYNKIRTLQKNLEVVLNKIDSILKTFDDIGDTDILFQISNYLVDNVSYSNGYEDAYDAFIYNKTVCNGYATAFNMMANKAGITSDICIGTAYNGDYHAWNIVTLNNGDKKYYDTTLYRLAKNKKYINNSQNPNKTYILNDYSKELLV